MEQVSPEDAPKFILLTLDIVSIGDNRPVWLLIYNKTADIAIFRASKIDTAK